MSKVYTPVKNRPYVETKVKAKIIKEALKKHLPEAEKISVRKGTGTASGWITATITMKKPCSCEATYCGCNESHEFRCKTRETVDNIARTALEEAGTAFYSFTADDGYGTQHSCFNVSIDYAE